MAAPDLSKGGSDPLAGAPVDADTMESEADHPRQKYREAYVEGSDAGRVDDTGVAGMPADRPVATPKEGLGNDPGDNEPEPKGMHGGLDSVPDELGRNPHPHLETEAPPTRQRTSPEEHEPLIRTTGPDPVDASMEPGTIADRGEHGSTEFYDPDAAAGIAAEERKRRRTSPVA